METIRFTLVEALSEGYRSVRRELEERLRDLDLTVDQWRALQALDRNRGATMGELADQLQTSPATTTRIVDALVDAALVFRRPGTHDRRQVEAMLSEAGHDVLAQAEQVVRDHETSLTGALGADGVRQLTRALEELRAATTPGAMRSWD